MPSGLFLDADALAELTGKRRSDAQARELDAMGIPHTARSNGSLVVLRSAVERLLGGEGTVLPEHEPEVQP